MKLTHIFLRNFRVDRIACSAKDANLGPVKEKCAGEGKWSGSAQVKAGVHEAQLRHKVALVTETSMSPGSLSLVRHLGEKVLGPWLQVGGARRE